VYNRIYFHYRFFYPAYAFFIFLTSLFFNVGKTFKLAIASGSGSWGKACVMDITKAACPTRNDRKGYRSQKIFLLDFNLFYLTVETAEYCLFKLS